MMPYFVDQSHQFLWDESVTAWNFAQLRRLPVSLLHHRDKVLNRNLLVFYTEVVMNVTTGILCGICYKLQYGLSLSLSLAHIVTCICK
jgi:hypothetical protein